MSVFSTRWLATQLPNPQHVGESEYACVHEYLMSLARERDGGTRTEVLTELSEICDRLAETAAEMARTLRATQ